ncbi:hypothetical protein C1645_811233 [Glomus cerebriforme]|uniref:Uncharacterized protein n=1 Tax=Glomus cerebriforme TaxID=658196 RepID=A0A397TN75_9GLOM|nr:hypothetical protein C1645_811233 [Glomus cerebriforme]
MGKERKKSIKFEFVLDVKNVYTTERIYVNVKKQLNQLEQIEQFNSYQYLSSKNSNTANKLNLIEETEATKATDIAKIIDLEATFSEVSIIIIQSKSKCNNSETENKSDAELELEVNYKFVIKQVDGVILLAKNYSVTISELDEFLLAIQNNITKSNSDNEEAICDESIPKINNNNKVSKISDIFILDQRIAKNVTEHYLKDREPHTKINNIMFSTWATEMLNKLATVKEPPTHPSFRFKKQRIKVKHLNKLNDTQFEACEVIAIEDIETIREAAQNYK